jgi:RHS repeat-associated protein
VTDASQDGERMKFTGHERDLAGAGGGDDLDYMHARYYSSVLTRFLNPDPVASAKQKIPQSWNKYGYALNNPIRFIDPDGEVVTVPKSSRATVERGINESAEFRRIYTRLDGLPARVANLKVQLRARARSGTFAESGLQRRIVPGQSVESVTGNVLIPLSGAKDPSVIGHELFHAEELLNLPPVLGSELLKRDDIWPSVKGGFESQGAIDAGNLIKQELGSFSGEYRYVVEWSCNRGACRVTSVNEILPPE